jgi:hypothetical protein
MASANARNPTVWRVEEPVRRLAVLVGLFFVLVAAFLTAVGVVFPGAAVLWVLAIGAMLCMWRWCLVPYVALTSEHLEVQGVFSQRSVDYDSIRAVTPGAMGLQVETFEDGSVLVWAIQKSTLSEWLRQRTRADEIAAEIMERVELATRVELASA